MAMNDDLKPEELKEKLRKLSPRGLAHETRLQELKLELAAASNEQEVDRITKDTQGLQSAFDAQEILDAQSGFPQETCAAAANTDRCAAAAPPEGPTLSLSLIHI